MQNHFLDIAAFSGDELKSILKSASEMKADFKAGKGETVADTARVLSRYVDAIMIRTTAHDRLLEMAKYATVPVINGLTDETHPCQIMADIMTFEEHKPKIQSKRLKAVIA